MKMMQRSLKYLLIISVFISYNVLAIDYYWDTANPPGNVHWTEGVAITGADTLSINDLLNTTQDISNDGAIDINSSMLVNNDINGSGGMNINAGASLQFVGTNTIGQNTCVNNIDGTLEFLTSSVTNVVGGNLFFDNFGVINVRGIINDAAISNNASGVLSCYEGASVPSISIVAGDVRVFNDIVTLAIENHGNLQLFASVLCSSILSNGVFNVSGDMTVTGNQSISDGMFLNSANLNLSITNAATYDSLSVDGDVDLSDGAVNVTSTYSAPGGTSTNWDILTSGTNLITNGGTTINIPASTAFEQWSSAIIANTILRLSYINSAPSVTPLPGVDTEIAAVLAAMQANVTNPGQAELLAAVNSVTTQDLYNYLLNNLQPDTNNSSSSTTLAMQNIGFNKIESRVAGTGRKFSGSRKSKKGNSRKKSKANRTKTKSGFASGDLTPNTSMWMAGFGSLSKQHASGDNQGYRAKILGGMLGIDTKSRNDDVYGVAFGVSNANVYGLENTTFTTRILGYNLMVYGANNFKRNFFAEWILSGVINKNHGVRVFGVSGIDLSTESSYRGALGGARVNVGKTFRLNNTFNLSQVNTVQYVLVHQSDYNEGGSIAALHVVTKENQSILTLGTGFRLGIFNNDSWMVGNRELRAMVTYDVISPNQATTANFVVGSDSFIMNSSAVRLALKLGADYGVMISRKLSLQFSYDYEMRAGYYDNFGEVKLKYMF